jgi:aspartate/methionine/tyrosine aminotransferase
MMTLEPFLLDEWLAQKHSPDVRIDFDLGSSTGPVWTLRELLALEADGAMEALLDGDLFYTGPAGSMELRQAIAALEGADADHVQVVTGGAEALLLLFTVAAATPEGNVVLPRPGFPTNFALPRWLSLETRHYTLRLQNGFRIDPDEIRALVDGNTRFVLVNSPHNPTGAVLSDSELEGLHDFCAEREVQFVCDQVYHPIYHGPETRSAARLPHATVLGDFSKALCLSGLRTGWLIEPDAARRRAYRNARSYFTVSNTTVSERLGVIALRHHQAIYGRARRIAAANLETLDGFFAGCGPALEWVRPRGGMTAFPRLADGRDGRRFCQEMLASGVLLAPGDCFGMGADGAAHFRIGFAASGERFAGGVERLAELVTSPAARAAFSPTPA